MRSTSRNLGFRYIAIGVPTVVDAATIVNDTMEELIGEMEKMDEMRQLSGALHALDQAEKHEMIRELILCKSEYDVCDTERY